MSFLGTHPAYYISMRVLFGFIIVRFFRFTYRFSFRHFAIIACKKRSERRRREGDQTMRPRRFSFIGKNTRTLSPRRRFHTSNEEVQKGRERARRHGWGHKKKRNSPTLTHVPPIAEYSGRMPWVSRLSSSATLAPYPAATREARTPPDPPPITIRS